MLQALSEIVRNVAVIILLTTFLDMLLPNNNMQRFIKVIMGLFIMLAILNPMIELLDDDYELSAWQFSLPTEAKINTVLAQGKKIVNFQESIALDEYRSRLEKQIEALVKLIPKVGSVKCSVLLEPLEKVGAIGRIKKATIWVSLGENNITTKIIRPVEPVKIDIGGSQQQEEKVLKKTDIEVKEKIANLIANYYSLRKNAIEVIFY